MAETTKTSNQSFYPGVDIAGQAVNDFLGLQNQRILKDQALLKAESDLAVAQQKAEGDLQKEMLKQQTKAIEAEQKEREKERKQLQDLRADLPIQDGGLFNSHAQPVIQITNMIKQDLPGMIENLGVDGAVEKTAQVVGVKERLSRMHTDFMNRGNTLASKTGTDLDADAGMIEGYDDVAFNESTRVANMAERFVATRDENYNYFIEDRGYKDASGNKIPGMGKLPLTDWSRMIEEQDLPGLFKSQPKLNYERTLDEAFNSIVADNKGGVRMPSGFKTDEAIDIFLDFNLEALTPSKKHKPLFNTAISQFAIDNNIDFKAVMDSPDDRTEALSLFRTKFKEKAKQFREDQPSSSSSKKPKKTGENILSEKGFGQVTADKVQQVAEAFAGPIAGPVSPESMGIIGVATTGSVSVNFDDDFAAAIGAKSDGLTVQEAAFDADGNIFVSIEGSYGYNPYEEIPGAAEANIEAVEYKKQTNGFVINKLKPGYTAILQSLGDKLLSATDSRKVTDFYQGLDTPSQANFYAGLMVLARETNPEFEKKVKESFNNNVRGITYDELMVALR